MVCVCALLCVVSMSWNQIAVTLISQKNKANQRNRTPSKRPQSDCSLTGLLEYPHVLPRKSVTCRSHIICSLIYIPFGWRLAYLTIDYPIPWWAVVRGTRDPRMMLDAHTLPLGFINRLLDDPWWRVWRTRQSNWLDARTTWISQPTYGVKHLKNETD